MLLNSINRISPSFDLKSKESISPTLLLAGSLVLYYAVRSLVIDIALGPALGCLWLDVMSCAAAALLGRVLYRDIPEPLRLLARGIGMVVLIQVAFDGSTLFYAPAAKAFSTAPAPCWPWPPASAPSGGRPSCCP